MRFPRIAAMRTCNCLVAASGSTGRKQFRGVINDRPCYPGSRLCCADRSRIAAPREVWRSLSTAIKCFEENCRITDKKDMVAYNLNNGLYNLAKALEDMERRLRDIEAK